MRFRKKIIREVTNRLVQLGLTECPVCHAGSMSANRVPVLLRVGDLKSPDEGGDEDSNALFMIRVVCDLCGYTMLFDSKKHHGPDEPVIFRGSAELEDELDPDEE